MICGFSATGHTGQLPWSTWMLNTKASHSFTSHCSFYALAMWILVFGIHECACGMLNISKLFHLQDPSWKLLGWRLWLLLPPGVA
jgi:hypothetical protein